MKKGDPNILGITTLGLILIIMLSGSPVLTLIIAGMIGAEILKEGDN